MIYFEFQLVILGFHLPEGVLEMDYFLPFSEQLFLHLDYLFLEGGDGRTFLLEFGLQLENFIVTISRLLNAGGNFEL